MDINFSDYDLRTPLHLAASEGHFEIVEYLIQNGALIKKDRWFNDFSLKKAAQKCTLLEPHDSKVSIFRQSFEKVPF